jgi:Cu/Ag efflux protein CusF
MFATTLVWTGVAMTLAAAAASADIVGAETGASMMAGERGMHSMHIMPRSMTDMSEGEVRKVDSAAGKLTLRHGPLSNLKMPGMTMVFRVKDPRWLSELKVGDKVRFVAERVDGNLTVTALVADQK